MEQDGAILRVEIEAPASLSPAAVEDFRRDWDHFGTHVGDPVQRSVIQARIDGGLQTPGGEDHLAGWLPWLGSPEAKP